MKAEVFKCINCERDTVLDLLAITDGEVTATCCSFCGANYSIHTEILDWNSDDPLFQAYLVPYG